MTMGPTSGLRGSSSFGPFRDALPQSRSTRSGSQSRVSCARARTRFACPALAGCSLITQSTAVFREVSPPSVSRMSSGSGCPRSAAGSFFATRTTTDACPRRGAHASSAERRAALTTSHASMSDFNLKQKSTDTALRFRLRAFAPERRVGSVSERTPVRTSFLSAAA